MSLRAAAWRLFPAVLVVAWCGASAQWGGVLRACGFRWLTGLPCPLCGMTGAFRALASGDVQGALRLNLLSPVAAALLLLLIVRCPWPERVARFGPAGVAAVFGVYGVLRATRVVP